jgi:uncharacterized protein YdiU (UPF0061 family)
VNSNFSLPFDNSYARLPARFYTQQAPEPVAVPGLIRVNHPLAQLLGIDPLWLESSPGIEVIAGNRVPGGADPLASVYAGHQFGSWNPQLGDGRAILLGEVIAKDGIRYDIQLKGSGRTPYSRGGDGRAPLGPVLREYVVSEAMTALGVPSTRALAAVTSGESVFREGALPGAVLARVAQSHIRIGTFQFFASKKDKEGLQLLSEHVIQRHFPLAAETSNPVLTMLEEVITRQATLIAKWQSFGFIHGVMNTDNMLLSGETIDYGPCAFMDSFDPAMVYSYIDKGGRYAYQNQPGIAHWNLSCLAQALLTLIDDDPNKAVTKAQAAIDTFPEQFQTAYRQAMSRKLGLNENQADSDALIQDLLDLMKQEKSDFTLTFRHLSDLAGPNTDPPAGIGALIELPESFSPWLIRWKQKLEDDLTDPSVRQAAMYQANPVFIPRNHLVEAVIDAAVNQEDYMPFNTLVDALASPYEYRADLARFATPPRENQVVKQTFCGT